MAGSARLSSRSAPSIAAPPSSTTAQPREGFLYEDVAGMSTFPTETLLGQPRRAMDHRSLQPLPFPLHQHPQHQQQHRQHELAMKRRISEEMERDRERILYLERGRNDRLLMERASRIAGSNGRIFDGDGSVSQIPSERSSMKFPDKRLEGAGILGSNAAYVMLDRRPDTGMGSSLLKEDREKAESFINLEKLRGYDRRNERTENVMDRGFLPVEALKGQEEPHSFDTLRPFGIVRGTEKHGVKEFPRTIENARMQDNARGLNVPRAAENFRESLVGMDISRNVDQLRATNARAMDMHEANSRSAEQPHSHYRGGLDTTLVSRDKLRSSESLRVVDKSRSLESKRHMNSPLVATMSTGLNRQLDNVITSERGFESTIDEVSNRSTYRSTLRQANHDRRRSIDSEQEDREQEDEKSRDSRDKQRERPTDVSMQELVAQYKIALAELTFNSKPIITNLTIIAGENLHASKAIAATVCAHILEVPIEQKLPSLYLLDSIVKNISSSYVKHFAARLPEVFVKSYRQVDPSQHPAMQHLFKTWRGVFNSEPLREIERELQFNILGTDGLHAPPQSNPARLTESPPPQQRPGHGIHVNPKYLEAQRQKLQQSNQLQSRNERGGNILEKASTIHKLSASLPEFDYATLGDKRGVNGERKNAWDVGFPIKEEENSESTSFRHRVRNGFDIQHSPRALIDAYGNVRGMRSSRATLPPVQSVQELDSRDVGRPRNWQNAEEEEYSWADVNPKVRDVDEKLLRDKDEWLHGGAAKNLLPGTLSAQERASGQAGLGKLSGVIDWPSSVEDVNRKDLEGDPLRSSTRSLSLDPQEDSHVLGLTNLFGEQHPMVGCLPHPVTEPPSPPQARPLPLQGNRTVTPSVFGRLSDVTNPGLKSTEGAAAISPVVSHSLLPSVSGPMFGGVNLKLEAFPPGTASLNVSFQQRQVSAPSRANGAQIHSLLPFPNLPPPSQPSSSPLHQQSFYPKPAQFVGQVPDKQSNSLQQPVPLRVRFPPVVLQSPPLPAQKAKEHLPDQAQSHPGSTQTTPVLPQIPSHLLQSLQQLQRHLPVLSESLTKVNLPAPAPYGQDDSQAASMKESTQLSGGLFPTPLGLQLAQVLAPVGSMSIEDTVRKFSGTQFAGTGNNIFAALLQSTLKPPNGGLPQVNPESLVPSLVPGSESITLASQPFPGGPPLPFGPPPSSVGSANSAVQLAPVVSSLTSSSVAIAPLPVPPTVAPTRLTHPPLPPGPPPPSQPPQQTPLVLQPPPSSRALPASGADLNSLLSSLMAHGVLSAPAPTCIPAQQPGAISNPSSGILGPNPSSHMPLGGMELYGKVLPPSSVVLSTASITESRILDPPSKAVNETSGFDGTEFKQELLRERRDSVIKALYSDFPRQCKTCGLRFKHQEEHSEHMDWHVTRNRRQKSAKKVSRKWFVNTKEWLSGTGAASSEVSPAFFPEVVEKMEEPEKLMAVPADENQVTCALCGEPFEDFYSDEIDEWMYKGAVYLNVPPGSSVEGFDKSSLGPIVHANCRSESAASTAADVMEEADLNDSYLQG
ncbi:hypothetical protein GOP47_0013515 [Adiantum capillus-veneris]|uniref:CID domain-containing protein n=1 Tax=Adiantum capillus-veneris TaxID=13818 RepID=A0A9D4UP76_ADICA|nr:hypothetical protein GOP47_0013515 [Adiantum capillus-veneris]